MVRLRQNLLSTTTILMLVMTTMMRFGRCGKEIVDGTGLLGRSVGWLVGRFKNKSKRLYVYLGFFFFFPFCVLCAGSWGRDDPRREN
uniref:Uncharacterized protein n=1 Tax=Octopus bimaculoides TaxID=37653 RepID=A0A0L8HFL0_OCTBM